MEITTIKHLKKDDFFTLKPYEDVKLRNVWVRGTYDSSTNTFECSKFSRVCHRHFFNPNRIVYTYLAI